MQNLIPLIITVVILGESSTRAVPLIETAETLESAASTKGDELVFVHAVWRHGDRAPLNACKNDPIQGDAWPQGFGELSVRGMEQHFRLGKKLRRRYVDELKFLKPTYDAREVFVWSTDVNRTIASAISNMAGFYAPSAPNGEDSMKAEEDEKLPRNLVVVPIHVTDMRTDMLAATGGTYENCARKQELSDLIINTPQYRQFLNDTQELFAHLTEICGQTVDDRNFKVVWDTAFVEELYNHTVSWLTDELRAQMSRVYQRIQRFRFALDMEKNNSDIAGEMASLQGGPLLTELVDRMITKSECDAKIGNEVTSDNISGVCRWINRLKYYVYSGHDETLSALSTIFGNNTAFDKNENPYYSTAITVELWKSANGTYTIDVLLWDPRKDGPKSLLSSYVKGCVNGCTLEQFRKFALPYRPQPTLQELCAKKELNDSVSASSKLLLPSLSLYAAFFASAFFTIRTIKTHF